MSPKKKLQIALSAITALIAFGTLGFKLILPFLSWFDAFYFTLITLTIAKILKRMSKNIDVR